MEAFAIILINFAHPLTTDDVKDIGVLIKQPLLEIRNINAQLDPQGDVTAQVEVILDSIGFSSEQWQNTPIIINLPSLNYSAAIMLAMLHGRMGYFPAVLRMRPEPEALPPRFVVAGIINLQALREKARKGR